MTKFILKIVALSTLILAKYWMFPEAALTRQNTQSQTEVIKLVDQPASDSSAVTL